MLNEWDSQQTFIASLLESEQDFNKFFDPHREKRNLIKWCEALTIWRNTEN